MKQSDKLSLRISEIRQKLNELSGVEEPTQEQLTEIETLSTELSSKETQYRAALKSEDGEAEQRAALLESGQTIDAEERERNELRNKSLFGRYLIAELTGKQVKGAESEYRESLGVVEGVPLDLFEKQVEKRADAPTVEPSSNTPINPARIAPQVFASALLPSLGVEMPVVPSGSYGQPRLTKSLTASPQAKGGNQESTAGTIATTTTTPHRISARLSLQIEDLLGSGLPDMESSLRENLSLVMSDALDQQGLTGDGTGANLNGLYTQVAAATKDSSKLTYETGVSKLTGFVDGVWAMTKMNIQLVTNSEVYALASTLYRGQNADTSLADFWEQMLGGYRVHKRMPSQSSDVADALVVLNGQMGIRKSVCPVWNRSLMIDDMYTDAGKGQRHFTTHAIVGDVLIAQPDAYKRVSIKTA